MDICKGENITKTLYKKTYINDDSFKYAVDGFIKRSSDTFKSIYDAAVKNELGWYILKTFSHNARGKLSFDVIRKKVNNGKASFEDDKIREKLEELMSPSFNIIYYNHNSDKYALSNPFWHRFLRLQFSLEQSKHSKTKKDRKNPNLRLIEKDIKYTIVDKSMLELINSFKFK